MTEANTTPPLATAASPFQDNTLVTNTENVKNPFSDSFNKIGDMPSEYSMVVESNISPVQNERRRVAIEAKN